MNLTDLPLKQGLYDPRNEHDSCGVGFVVNIKGKKSHDIIRQGLQILVNLDHRGAVGADPLVGDGAGCMIQTPDALLREAAKSGRIGELAPRFHGAPTNRSQRVTLGQDCPELLARLQEDKVDAAVLVAV